MDFLRLIQRCVFCRSFTIHHFKIKKVGSKFYIYAFDSLSLKRRLVGRYDSYMQAKEKIKEINALKNLY